MHPRPAIQVHWSTFQNSMVSNDIYHWHGMTGEVEDIKKECATDTQCVGFFECTDNGVDSPNCKDYPDQDVVLLAAIPAVGSRRTTNDTRSHATSAAANHPP